LPLDRFLGGAAMIKLRAFFRTYRGILWGTNAFFLALAIFFVGYAWWVAVLLKQSIQADFHSRAEAAAVRTADAVAVNINARFHDLAFLRNVFFA